MPALRYKSVKTDTNYRNFFGQQRARRNEGTLFDFARAAISGRDGIAAL